MSPGKKPELRKPPRLAQEEVDSRLSALEKAGEWATKPAVEDAAAAGLSAPQEEAPAVQGELVPATLTLRDLRIKTEKVEAKDVKHLVRINAELNGRIEWVLNNAPRLSKQKLIIHAIELYVTSVERAFERARAGQGASTSS